MDIRKYLESTYLKFPSQSGLTEEQTKEEVIKLVEEAMKYEFLLVMIRPEYVSMAKKMIREKESDVLVGTVIGFHEGTYSLGDKLKEALDAIENGADELDYVINYEEYKKGNKELAKKEFVEGTALALENGKVAKWIIEIAALTDQQIQDICTDISTWAQENFDAKDFPKIFTKSSTGFYPVEEGKQAGATPEGVDIMLKYSAPLPVKPAGGIKSYEMAVDMINKGVKRLGTSSAKMLFDGGKTKGDY